MIISSKVIAVDFDGTIVRDKYPGIGKPIPFAFETLKLLQKDGHQLILWTVRSGKELREAVEFCAENGVEFDAVNETYAGEKSGSRKVNADIFIDDRNVGGLLQWGEIYQIISGKDHVPKENKPKGWWEFFK